MNARYFRTLRDKNNLTVTIQPIATLSGGYIYVSSTELHLLLKYANIRNTIERTDGSH